MSRHGTRLACIEPDTRLRLLELAARELLESETNGSMVIGAGSDAVEPVVVTALGCSVLLAVGHRSPVLMSIAALRPRGVGGPRALAQGCERALRAVNHLPADFAISLSFGLAANASGFLHRLL
ncbi:MAG TPA: hypothetical protein VI434_02030 [Candidatus Dormibacteraeota bacterium]